MARIDSEYFEIDLPYCKLTFGESPCTATGTPCFNTRNLSYDCQDTANYDGGTLTVRFYKDTGHEFPINDGVPTYPLLNSARTSGTRVKPAESMGERATATITLGNTKSLMVGLDKNIIARSQSEYDNGTFLGKFFARNPYLNGVECRYYRGYLGQPHRVYHYVIDGFSGPSNLGAATISCVDALSLTDGSKSQYPVPSRGYLAANLASSVTAGGTFDVEPVGIGDIDYPASGYVAIGNEAIEFTRSGDTFTIVERASKGEISDHEQEDAVQVCGVFESETVATIINTLIQATPISSSYVPIEKWNTEISSYIPSLFSAFIVKPTSVKKLINELIPQAGLIFHADIEARELVLKALRPIIGGSRYTDDNAVFSSQKSLEDKRVSQVYTFYNQKTPFKQLDDESNYYSQVFSQTSENLYGTESLKKVFSRWIPAFAQSVAQTLNSRLLERYQNPPREYAIQVPKAGAPKVGEAVILESRIMEDAFGLPSQRECYLTEVNHAPSTFKCTAQEYTFAEYTGPGGGSDIIISIDATEGSVSTSLRAIYDTQYVNLSGVTSVTFIVRRGVACGDLSVGDFGALTPLLIIEEGAFLVGIGGTATASMDAPGPGDRRNGGNAFDADYPIDVELYGTIGGGGGAGGRGNYGPGSLPRIISGGSKVTVSASQVQFGGAGSGVYSLGAGMIKDGVEVLPPQSGLPDVFNGPYVEPFQGLLVEPTGGGQRVSQFATDGTTAGNGGWLGRSGKLGAQVTLGGPFGVSPIWATSPAGLPGKAITNNANINWIANTGSIIGEVE